MSRTLARLTRYAHAITGTGRRDAAPQVLSGAVTPHVWRRCPICASAEFVPAPGGIVPPCPCLTEEA